MIKNIVQASGRRDFSYWLHNPHENRPKYTSFTVENFNVLINIEAGVQLSFQMKYKHDSILRHNILVKSKII